MIAGAPVLFARNGALGDFVLTLPALAALAARGPVHVLAPARYAPLLPAGATRVDDGWVWRNGPPPAPYARAYAFAPGMADALRDAGVPSVRQVAPRPPEGVHATAHFAGVLEAEIREGADGGPPVDLRPRLVATPDPRVTDRPVVIAPGSGGREKRWPLARWREVADPLADVPVRWVAGPVEAEEEGWPSETERPDLPGLLALAAAAGAWIGPDSGPSHLADAVGADVAAVFGPTDPRAWAPAGATVVAWHTAPSELAAFARSRRLRRLSTDRGGDPG